MPLIPSVHGWRLDVDALAVIDPKPVSAALVMSPAMPTGAVFNQSEWQALFDFCRRTKCWLINDAAMERILFDGRSVIHPASFPDMREKVITVGSASKEYRMIGWRVGWVVGPAGIIADVARVSISNVVCQTGIAMGAVATAIKDPNDGIQPSVAEWQPAGTFYSKSCKNFMRSHPMAGGHCCSTSRSLGWMLKSPHNACSN